MRTVESHRAHIQQKLQVTKRSELVRYAIGRGLLEARRVRLSSVGRRIPPCASRRIAQRAARAVYGSIIALAVIVVLDEAAPRPTRRWPRRSAR